jgi:hypothetical protein
MGSCLFPTMGTTKKVDPIRSKGWPQMQCDKPRAKGWGRPNQMHNVIEKTFEINQITSHGLKVFFFWHISKMKIKIFQL